MPPHPLARGIFRAQKLYVPFYLACLGFRRSGNIPKTGDRVNNSTESTYDTTDSSCNCCPRLTVVLVMAPVENVLINLSEQSRLHAIARRPYNEALSTWRLSSNEKPSSWRIFVSPTVARWVRLCVCCWRLVFQTTTFLDLSLMQLMRSKSQNQCFPGAERLARGHRRPTPMKCTNNGCVLVYKYEAVVPCN